MTITTAQGSRFAWLLPSPPDPAMLPHVFGAGPSNGCTALDRRVAREIRVVPLNSAGAAAWDDFVELAPNATFFHRAGWQEVIQRSFGHSCYFLQAKCGGRTTGVLPLVHLRSRLFGNALISNAYGVYGGPLASDEESLGALNGAAVDLAARLGVDYLEYRLRSPSILPWAAQFRGFMRPSASPWRRTLRRP